MGADNLAPMNRPHNGPLLHFFLALSLGCVSSTTPAGPSADPGPAALGGPASPPATGSAGPIGGDEDGFEPIRFGDPVELSYTEPFFPGATYDESITSPDELLGQPQGSRLTRHDELVGCLESLADESPRVTLTEFGRTYEGRPLVRAVITSEANHARLDEILDGVGRLADPRGVSAGDTDTLVESSPAVAWMGYSIHGDELSGSDGGLALAYHLAASTDEDVAQLLDEVVVLLDPCLNPDGRARIISQVEQSAGYEASLDYASMHRGRWPYGRGNHYLFDLNRDWMAGIHPETRGRWEGALKFHPQLFVDAHEMGSLDTFLFSPPRKPLNPNLPEHKTAWGMVFAADQARAFDRFGWSYYTREWFESWYPAYSDAWGSLNGAVGILYEQAGTAGSAQKRASGDVLTYREAVHHQAASSLANLETLRENRSAILKSYADHKRANVSTDTPGNDRAFAFRTGRHPDREAYVVETLRAQGIEVFVTEGELEVSSAVDSLGKEYEDGLTLPEGTVVIPAAQPQSPLVKAFLDFDPRFDSEELLEERRELEQKHRSKVYDTTAWSLGHALDLDAFWIEAPSAELEPMSDGVEEALPALIGPRGEGPVYGWVVDGKRDASVRFANRAMELGLQVHVADKAFGTEGRTFHRGSLLVRRHENAGDDVAERVRRAAEESGVHAYATRSGRSLDEGPDLGGGHFTLLAKPRVGLVANSPVRIDTYGHLWFQLDHELGIEVSHLDAQTFGSHDLRRYNVLVLPPAGGSMRALIEAQKERLADWVSGGGTLIACGSTAAMLADEDLGLSGVRLRRDSLEDLDEYRYGIERELAAAEVAIDEALLWEGEAADNDEADEEEDDADEPEETDPDAEREDAWKRLFSPRGVFTRGRVDGDSWLTFGCDTDQVPVFTSGDAAFLALHPIQVPLRLTAADDMRLGGLLWPEARERLEHTAALTRESRGRGQVILFAGTPGFRGFMKSDARFFANAVVFGPGAGASQPVGW